VLITVSTDTEFTHLAWHRHEKSLADVRYLMGSDVTGEIARLFGVYDASSGLALRGAFLINPDGVLLNSEVNFFNLGRNIDELLRKFKANLYLAKQPDDGVPAQWRDDGDKTLTPSPDMVGNVHEAMQD